MSRHQTVNEEFSEALRTLYGIAEVPPSLLAIVGVPYGEALDPAHYPILGFYLMVEGEAMTLFVLTPGRLIRFESVGDRTLTVGIPAHRIARVAEETGPAEVVVLIEMDADVQVTDTEYQEAANPLEPAELVGRKRSRTTRADYRLVATEETKARELLTFSLALRNTLGV